MGFGGGALLQKEKVGARRKLCEVNLLSCGVEGWVGRLLSTTGFNMFDEVTRERGAWDDLCVEPQVRALARRGFCKPCKKFHDDNNGLEAHGKRHHPRPPVPRDEKDADGEREA